ncbi:MAG: pantoate--beta-alanine ligase [Proteobacteria bacterium]|nr:pantoate--beta-alanine ligase [Pseudomonadota bacterium]
MNTYTEKSKLRVQLNNIQSMSKSIGLVPTMGNLHAGHIELIKAAKAKTDYVVCTIFVNPLQFGAHEDLDAYPRTLDSDIQKLTAEGCDCLFAPSVIEIYGSDLKDQTFVRVPRLSEIFCGRSRPGHFDGVATIVIKLFNIVRPDVAFFGLKDYQQFLIIKKLIIDLALDIEITGVEIQRDDSGLALSSRNNYLNTEQKISAALLYQCLLDTAEEIQHGDQKFVELEQAAIDRLAHAGVRPDYYSICNAEDLQPASKLDRKIVILVAADVGPSRLIDNVRFEL